MRDLLPPVPLNAKMVDRLVHLGYIKTPQIAEAFRAIPRHLFLPGTPLETVYSGGAIPTRFGPDGLAISSSSEPAIMALMIEQLQVQRGQRVLEVGAGTGYNAAILAFLTGPQGEVTTIDIDPEIVGEAQGNLLLAGFSGVRVVWGDGWLGVPEHAPYDRIEVTVGIWDLSPYWAEQLSPGGILVVPLWLKAGIQASVAFQKQGDRFQSLSLEPCGFMRLRGPHAGPETYMRLNGWYICLDGPNPEEIAILKDLLHLTPQAESVPKLPKGWFIHLALAEPSAIRILDRKDTRWEATGIFDPKEKSLAVVAGQRILTFGGDSALARLREYLARAKPLDLRDLHMEAIPSTRSVEGQSEWVIRRPFFTFKIWGRESGAPER